MLPQHDFVKDRNHARPQILCNNDMLTQKWKYESTYLLFNDHKLQPLCSATHTQSSRNENSLLSKEEEEEEEVQFQKLSLQ